MSRFSWTIAGNVAFAASQWGVLSILARFGGAELLGQFSYALAVATPIFMLFGGQLHQLQASDVKTTYSPMTYIVWRALTLTLASLSSIAIGLILAPHLLLCIAWMSTAKFADGIGEVLHAEQHRHDRFSSASRSLVARGIASLLGTACGLKLLGTADGAVAGYALARMLAVAAIDAPRVKLQFPPSKPTDFPHLAQFRSLSRLTLPLALGTFFVSLLPNVPRYFIESTLGSEPLGIYSGVAYFLVVGTTAAQSMLQAITPPLGRAATAPTPAGFLSVLGGACALAVAIGILGWLVAYFFGETIVQLAYGPDFEGAGSVLTTMMVAGLFGHVTGVFRQALVARRRVVGQNFALASAIATSCALSYVLVPNYQLQGAAIALTASTVVQACGCLLLLARDLRNWTGGSASTDASLRSMPGAP